MVASDAIDLSRPSVQASRLTGSAEAATPYNREQRGNEVGRDIAACSLLPALRRALRSTGAAAP